MAKNNKATKKCPHCSEEINAEANKCKYCGEWLEKLSHDLMGQNSRHLRGGGGSCLRCLILIIPAVVIFIIIVIVASSSGGDSQLSGYYKQPGDEAIIYLADTEFIYTAIDKPSGEELNKRLLAKDFYGVTVMESSGSIFRVNINTKIKILESDALSGLYEVRILEGDNTGRSGWVMNAFVK